MEDTEEYEEEVEEVSVLISTLDVECFIVHGYLKMCALCVCMHVCLLLLLLWPCGGQLVAFFLWFTSCIWYTTSSGDLLLRLASRRGSEACSLPAGAGV